MVKTALLLAVVGLFVTIVTCVYVGQEQYVYFWDTANYFDKLDNLAAKWQTSPTLALQSILDSFVTNYSDLPTLLLLPLRLLFGTSRLVYVLSLAFVYLVPFCFAMAYLSTLLVTRAQRPLFWITTILSLLIPAVWIPVLRGYPDIGGTTLLVLAFAKYIQNRALNDTKQILWIALLLSLAAMFRRYFAYSAVAFIGTLAIEILCVAFKKYYGAKGRQRPSALLCVDRKKFKQVLYLFLYFSAFSPILLLKVYFIDYGSVYSSYSLPINDNVSFYLGTFGLVLVGLAALGYWLPVSSSVIRHGRTAILAWYGSLSFIQWALFVRQIDIHYATQFAPAIIVGLALLVHNVLGMQGKKKIPLLAAIGLVFALNFLRSLAFIPASTMPCEECFARVQAPLRREDLTELDALTDFLDANNPAQDPVFVAASSTILNREILQQRALNSAPPKKLSLASVPQVDSRDSYPLQSLLSSRFVVLASPFQHHLPAAEQQVVKVVWDSFANNLNMARDFKPIAKTFALDNAVQVEIFERYQPSGLANIIEAAKLYRARISTKPANENYWLHLSPDTKRQNPIRACNEDQKDCLPLLLYYGDVPALFDLRGTVDRIGCANFEPSALSLAPLDGDGNKSNGGSAFSQKNGTKDFSVTGSGLGAKYLAIYSKFGSAMDSRCISSLTWAKVLPK